MGLLDALLKAYLEEVQPGSNKVAFVDQFVENVEKPSTSSQHNELTTKNNISRLETRATGYRDPIFSISKKAHESKKLGLNIQNVEDVACVRESESANLTSFIHIRVPLCPSPVGSHGRVSNILNKLPGLRFLPPCGALGLGSGCGRWDRGGTAFIRAISMARLPDRCRSLRCKRPAKKKTNRTFMEIEPTVFNEQNRC